MTGLWRTLGLSLPVALFGAGCTGSAAVQLVSIHPRAIDPPSVDIRSFGSWECYWWVEESGDLNIAIRCENGNPLAGRLGRVELNLSWVLDKPPAGSGRDYRIHSLETRTVLDTALETHRFVSYAGMVKVLVTDDEHLKGTFRMLVMHRGGFAPLSLLQGPKGNFMLFGTFQALLDPRRGRAIRERTESDGWARPKASAPPRSTSQPSEADNSGPNHSG